MKKYWKIFLGAVAVFWSLIFGLPVYAEALKRKILDELGIVQVKSQLPAGDPASIVALIIQGVLGIIVIVFFITIVVAGFKWMTSDGNQEVIDKSKKTIQAGVIGTLVVMFAYAISKLVFDVVLGK